MNYMGFGYSDLYNETRSLIASNSELLKSKTKFC